MTTFPKQAKKDQGRGHFQIGHFFTLLNFENSNNFPPFLSYFPNSIKTYSFTKIFIP
jgi:hypothetical protein